MVCRRRVLSLLALVLGLAFALPARAGTIRAYDAGAFGAAQEAGQGIVVWVHAPW